MKLVTIGATRRSLALLVSGFALVGAGGGCSSAEDGALPEEGTEAVASGLSRGVLGDVDGDGLGDIALTGGFIPSSGAAWTTVPVAHSNADGSFRVTNHVVPSFPLFATQSGAAPVAGDFDGDGRTDLALVGGKGWGTIPVARSEGDGKFGVTNLAATDFATYAAQLGAVPVAGDFNGDGRTDIALTGGRSPSGAPWGTIPVAFSNGNGTFRVTNLVTASFPLLATQWNAKVVAADFNNDGRTDLALVGGYEPGTGMSFVGPAWTTVPVAFSNGDGTFRVTNYNVTDFPIFATQGALAVAGDFNGDGYGDIALTGGRTPSGAPWGSVPVAFSNGNGTFRVTNLGVADFPTFATQGAQVVAADFDHDGKTDLALTGGAGWTTVPVAFSKGDGSFRVTNKVVATFPTYATQASSTRSPTAVSASNARR